MTWLRWFITGAIQMAFILAIAPLFSGFARVLRARIHSRKGPSIFQDYRDLLKLLRRQEVIPAQTTWVFRTAPYMLVATTLAAAGMVPILSLRPPLGFVGDGIAVVYLLILGRFALALAGMDSGSGFAGIGTSREMTLAAVTEPTMLLVLLVLGLGAGSTDLGEISISLARGPNAFLNPSLWLAMAAFAVITLVEMGKRPFDLAEAEQEIQEGTLSEYSGRLLAVLKWAQYSKQALAAGLFIALFFPMGIPEAVSAATLLPAAAWFAGKMAVVYLAGAVVENSMARLILYRAPDVTWLAFAMAVGALMFRLANA